MESLRVGVGGEMEQHFARVVDVHVGVHRDDVSGEHHLTHAPEVVLVAVRKDFCRPASGRSS